VILADPPWQYKVWSRDTGLGRSAESHYPTMSIEELTTLPVASIAAPDCVLFCWVTWPLLYEAAPVWKAWGFTYRTAAFAWVKVTKNGKPAFGMGYWTRANTEICLLLTRGSPKRKDKGVPQVIWEEYETETIIAPFRGHSVKPDEQYRRIEQLTGSRYVELFARRPRIGWDVWGNDIESDLVLVDEGEI